MILQTIDKPNANEKGIAERLKTDACMQHAIQHNYSFVGFFGRKDVNYTTCGFFDRGQYIVRYLDWR